MRLFLTISAIAAFVVVMATTTARAAEPVGWCDWLPWTCDTLRTPIGWDSLKETVECRMRRIRYCCNSEPPAPNATCPGPSATGRRRDLGSEQWARRAGSYRNMECPADPVVNYNTFFTSLRRNACTTSYPKPDPGSTLVWCPWQYWSTWNFNSPITNDLCKRIRTRSRRCDCANRRWILSGTENCQAAPTEYTEKQEQTVNCSLPDCPKMPRIIIDDFPMSPVPVVLGCLAVLLVAVAAVITAILCATRCKRKRAASAAASQTDVPTSFASRMASSFRRGVGIGVTEPTAPAYGSAAFYNDAGVPVPTVSLKVFDKESHGQSLPPPYTSQPELPRDTRGGGPSGSPQPQFSPPPYSRGPNGGTWDSPPVEQ